MPFLYAQVIAYMLKFFGHFIQTTFHKKSGFSPKRDVFRPQNLCVLTKKGLVLRPKISENWVFWRTLIRPTIHISVGVPG